MESSRHGFFKFKLFWGNLTKMWIILQLYVNIYIYLQVIFNRQWKVEICCRNICYRNTFLEEKSVEIPSRNLADNFTEFYCRFYFGDSLWRIYLVCEKLKDGAVHCMATQWIQSSRYLSDLCTVAIFQFYDWMLCIKHDCTTLQSSHTFS